MKTLVGYSSKKSEYDFYGNFNKACANYLNGFFIRYTFSLWYSVLLIFGPRMKFSVGVYMLVYL